MINDIRRKYEVENLESINLEKEKAGKAIEEMQAQCDQKLTECKEESKQYLKRIQEEQAGLVCNYVLKKECLDIFKVMSST